MDEDVTDFFLGLADRARALTLADEAIAVSRRTGNRPRALLTRIRAVRSRPRRIVTVQAGQLGALEVEEGRVALRIRHLEPGVGLGERGLDFAGRLNTPPLTAAQMIPGWLAPPSQLGPSDLAPASAATAAIDRSGC
jgi:hypothetical protein